MGSLDLEVSEKINNIIADQLILTKNLLALCQKLQYKDLPLKVFCKKVITFLKTIMKEIFTINFFIKILLQTEEINTNFENHKKIMIFITNLEINPSFFS